MSQEKTIALVAAGFVVLALALIGAWVLWPCEAGDLHLDMRSLGAKVENLQSEKKQLQSMREELESKLENLKCEIGELTAQVEDLEAEKQGAMAHNKRLSEEKTRLTTELQRLKKEVAKAKSSESESEKAEARIPWKQGAPSSMADDVATRQETEDAADTSLGGILKGLAESLAGDSTGEGAGGRQADGYGFAEVEYKVSAASLWKTYQDNEINADAKYKGRVLEVSGDIHSITHDGLGTPSVIIDVGEWELGSIKCDVIESALHTLKSLHKGVRVTMRGKCTGKVMMFVGLENCTVASP